MLRPRIIRLVILRIGGATGEGADCIPVSADLSMPLSCVAYNGTQYSFTLRFYKNPYDPKGLYWKMDAGTFMVNQEPSI